MTTVFIVFEAVLDDWEVVSVHATREGAEAVANEVKRWGTWPGRTINEFEVNR